nr:trem-like transcript 1 protein isoform X3 [Manis javanica]
MLGGRCFLPPGNTVSAQAGCRAVSPCPAMGPNLLLLLFLGLAGQGSATSLPEALQAPVGGAILVQCHYRLQDIRAPKVWCRFLPEGCQPLVSSAVDRGAPGDGRMFLTDLGGGLLQVEMIGLREEDSGEYGCVVEGSAGPLTVHRVALDVFPPASGLKEEEEEEEKEKTHKVGSLADSPFMDPVGSASPLEPRWDEKRSPARVPCQHVLSVCLSLAPSFHPKDLLLTMAHQEAHPLPLLQDSWRAAPLQVQD